jgi:hypothetical protein
MLARKAKEAEEAAAVEDTFHRELARFIIFLLDFLKRSQS